jgi:hypothetical protein
MKWANSYDKKAVRAQYLGDNFSGKGGSRDDLTRQVSYMSHTSAAPSTIGQPPPLSPDSAKFPKDNKQDHDLPTLPQHGYSVSVRGPVEEARQPPPAPAPVSAPAPSKGPETTIISVVSDKETPATETVPASKPMVRASTDFFNKDVSISPANSPKVERKPLPKQSNLEIHPALRGQSTDQPVRASPSPNRGPAVLAAQKALESKVNGSPEPAKDYNVLRKQPTNGGAFKKMFGRSKTNRDSIDVQQQHAALSPASESSLTRRLSHMRSKKPGPPQMAQKAAETAAGVPVAQESVSNATSRQESLSQESPLHDLPTQGPTLVSPVAQQQHAQLDPVAPTQSREPVSPISPGFFTGTNANKFRADAREKRDAETEFARFDQGPMDDMPAAMPRDSIDDDANDAPDSPVKSCFDSRAQTGDHGHRNQQTPDEGFVTPLERNDAQNDAVSVISEEGDREPYAPQQIQDRWAQIRENAQRRAATRASEEQSRPSQSVRTDDDGATSEEESRWSFRQPCLIAK